MIIICDDVNDAFREIVAGLQSGEQLKTVASDSRVGKIRRVPHPVIVQYKYPRRRVLFNQVRDCNPFFHLFESLWMLSGSNRLAPLEFFNGKMKDFSDDGETLNGAYGYRWRSTFLVDQLRLITSELKLNPDSRRCTLQMWDTLADLKKIRFSKDVCCNTHAYFAMRDGKLDMTVCNRSNDLIWGLLGANAVHFSFLLEYMANCVRVPVGSYYQMTNDMHVYLNNWEPEEWLNEYTGNYTWYQHSYDPNPMLPQVAVKRVPECEIQLVQDQAVFDEECSNFVQCLGQLPNSVDQVVRTEYQEPFLQEVAYPMCMAFHYHKQRNYPAALEWLSAVASYDWEIAGRAWIAKRQRKWGE